MKTKRNLLRPGAVRWLRRVERHILEEPRRLRMSSWLKRKKTSSFLYVEWPACKTIGCIGGWTEVLYNKAHGIQPNWRRRWRTVDTILGLTHDQAQTLCFPKHLLEDYPQQTPEHAAKVVEHIEQFIRRNT